MTAQAIAASARGQHDAARHLLSQLEYNRTLMTYLVSTSNPTKTKQSGPWLG